MKQLSGWQNASMPPAADTGFLFEPHTGHTYVLNETGRFLYEGVRQGAPPEVLTMRLAQRYQIAPEVAAVDVADFLESLRQTGMGGSACA